MFDPPNTGAVQSGLRTAELTCGEEGEEVQLHTLVPAVARLVAQAGLEHPLLALLDLQVLVEHISSEVELDKADVSLNFDSGSENKEAATAAPQVSLMAALCPALRYLALPWNGRSSTWAISRPRRTWGLSRQRRTWGLSRLKPEREKPQ